MPVEDMEEEGLAKIPDLNIAQWIFTLKSNPVSFIFVNMFLKTLFFNNRMMGTPRPS